MSWQEDLQELDSALAAGRISADDYRRRRDELLTAAAGQPAPQPGQPQPQQGPFPPPFKWGPAQPQQQQDNPERTQLVTPQPQQPAQDADRTQFVRPVTGPQAQPQQQNPGDRTQVVPGPNSGGFPAQSWDQQGGWSQGDVISPPPWGAGVSDVDAWGVKQGPEVFDDEAGGGKGKIILIVVIVLLVAGLGVGAYFLWGRNGSGGNGGQTTAQQTSTQAPTTTTTQKKVPEGPFVEVPGKVTQFKTLKIEEALAAKIPTLEEAQLLQTAGVTEVRYAVGNDGPGALAQGIWAFKAKDPAAALEKIDALYQSANFELLTGTPTGVKVRHLPLTATNKSATYRAHYVSDDFVVRVEAYGPDEAAAKAAFDSLLERQLADYPAK